VSKALEVGCGDGVGWGDEATDPALLRLECVANGEIFVVAVPW
jgi:hypothetical protein